MSSRLSSRLGSRFWPALAVSGALAFASGASACSDADAPVGAAGQDDAGTDGTTNDAPVGADSAHAGHDAGGESDDAAAAAPIRCTDEELAANDLTDGGTLTVSFLAGANPKQYENRCATVKVGASVVFSGSFTQHPLEAAGGDSPSPIPYVASDQPDDTLTFMVPTAGTFGYQCEFHPTLMFGAIRVVP